jgi:hypothetical protein
MRTIAFDELHTTDLHVDALYQGGRAGNAGDDPLPRLLRVDSQGGFRKRGRRGTVEMLVLTSSMNDPDWPDSLDLETGVFTYYGDNKKPGRELHDTGRRGNFMLQQIFAMARSGQTGREEVPPVFLFSGTGSWRDFKFRGLAVPGVANLEASEELVAVWRSSAGSRFQNYRARFTVLDTDVIRRDWIDSIIAGKRDDKLAPQAWRSFVETGRRHPLRAGRSLEWRQRKEQLPQETEGQEIIAEILGHFAGRPHGFEHCAAALARMMIPDIATLDVTRPSRDGGRDAIGQMRIGKGASAVLVDFALEAKCLTEGAVGVKEMSRLISRLRHRQFGVLVTTSCVDRQAYQEIKEDQHPIVVISAADIVDLLRTAGYGSAKAVKRWLSEEFPMPS